MIAKSTPTFPRPGLPALYAPPPRAPSPPSPGIEVKNPAAAPLRLEGRPGQKSFRLLFQAEPMARLEGLKRGIPATLMDEVAREVGMPAPMLARALGLSPVTLARKRATHKLLSPSEGERLLGFARLIGQVEVMIDESGDPTGFQSARWMRAWLEQEVLALGGRKPRDLLDTMEGQSVLSEMLASVQSGTCL